MAKKSTCPITRKQFAESAESIVIMIGDRKYTAAPKQFSTGSLGWNLNEKTTIEIEGTPVTVQIGMNLTIVGSKELPPEPGASSSQDAETQAES